MRVLSATTLQWTWGLDCHRNVACSPFRRWRLHSQFAMKPSDTSAHMHACVMVMIPRLAAVHFVDDVESHFFWSHVWNTANVVPLAPSAFKVSCGTPRELDEIDAALMDVDGTGDYRRPGGARWRRARGEVVWKQRLPERYRCRNAEPRFPLRALVSCSLGSRNRLVGFSQCRHPPLPRSRASAPAEHFLQRLPEEINRDAYGGSRDPLGSVLSKRSDGTSGREMQRSRNKFGGPVLFTITAPGAAAVWCYNAYSWPGSSLQREE